MPAFHLTSPETRGEDVRALQKALNERMKPRHDTPLLKTDGVYGRATDHAVARVAYQLGIGDTKATEGVVRLIEHPHERNPVELERARKRAATEKVAIERELKAGTKGLAAILTHAEHYLGVHESPPESNWGHPEPAGWEENFGFKSGVSWCGCFAGSMILLAGGHVDSRVAFCPYTEADARSKTNGFDRWVPNHSEGVGPGWLALFNWSGGSEAEHVEIVKKVESTHLVCVGGNTSGDNPSDGGMVAEMIRPYQFVLGYAKPRL